jgi:hypothetical protein
MIESHSPFAFLGLALSISGVVSLGYTLVERLVSTRLFSVFLKSTPDFLTSQFRYEPAVAWFKVRSTRNLYDCWDVALVYLVLLSVMLAIALGFWILLVSRIFGIYSIRTSLLIMWFAVLCAMNAWAAVSQHALEIKAQHKRATMRKLQEYMIRNPQNTVRRLAYYFLRNWVETPLTIVKLLLTVVLFILLHWLAWLLKGVRILKIDLEDRNTRRYYYMAYGVPASIAGLLLVFFFR